MHYPREGSGCAEEGISARSYALHIQGMSRHQDFNIIGMEVGRKAKYIEKSG